MMLKVMDKEKRWNIYYMIVSAGMPIIIFSLLVQIWNLDLTVPYFGGRGDGISNLWMIRNFIDGNGIYTYSRLNSPWGVVREGMTTDGLLNILLMYLLARITKSVGLTYNVFFIVSFSITSLSAYLVTKKLLNKRNIALLAGLLYTFLPYHFMRVMHINLMTYYYIPFIVYFLIKLCMGQQINKRYIFITFFINGTESLYYAAFTLLLLAFVFVIMKKNKYCLGNWLCSILAILLGVLLVYALPKVVEISNNHISNQETVEGNTSEEGNMDFEEVGTNRTVAELNDYGLRIWALFSPVLYHRISELSEFTYQLYNDMSITYDAYMMSLGLLITVGLLYSMFSLAFRRGRNEAMVCGKLILFMLLLGMSYGVCILIGTYFTTAIRCYNRIIVYVAFASLISLSCLLRSIWDIKCINNKKNQSVFGGLLVFLMLFGIWDQTPSYLSTHVGIEEATPHNLLQIYEAYADQYYDEVNFWADVEKPLAEGDAVYIMRKETDVLDLSPFIFTEKIKTNATFNGYSVLINSHNKIAKETFTSSNIQSIVVIKSGYEDVEYKKQIEILENMGYQAYLRNAMGAAFMISN
ncbi:MAG: hypothetical protein QM697_00475 [Lachnospiraceae bacterium]